MKLSTNMLREISHGAVRVVEKEGRVRFLRFTEEQGLIYKNANSEFYKKALTSAGIRLVFKTDSTSMLLKVNISDKTTRSYFSYDIYVDDNMIGNIDNFNSEYISSGYTAKEYPLGEFSKKFLLGKGEKTVTIYLPWSVPSEIVELTLDDGAYVEAVKKDKKLLVLGDSISQGYDCLRPSKHYTSIISNYLNADCYNKCIGGERFTPILARTNENFTPDYVIGAYGTNDWGVSELDDFKENCKSFYEILSNKYKSSKIFAITPIWRADYKDSKKLGNFETLTNSIFEITKEFENIHCISGLDLVPHDKNLFGDLMLHPNEAGFEKYAKNLII